MDRHTTSALAKFCVDQCNTFNFRDWLLLQGIDDKAVALAARYLSMTSWYGHEDELEEIATRIHAFEQNTSVLYDESRQIDFDLPYFSVMVRYGVLRARAHWHEQSAQEVTQETAH